MSTEARRKCGYRKVGGLYLVSGGLSHACDRLPHELTICPCCNQGIKQTRGWTWVDANTLFGGTHNMQVSPSGGWTLCVCGSFCPACNPAMLKKTGLLWIGEQFYATPADFVEEGAAMGISRRITAIPRNFVLGETWVLFAHPKAVRKLSEVPAGDDLLTMEHSISKVEMVPGIFCVFKPERIEKIITTSMSQDPELMADLEKRGITAVIVPDDDKDHQGNVYEKDSEPEAVEPVPPAGAKDADRWLWEAGGAELA